MMATGYAFLASPYYHPDREIREWRFRQTEYVLASLIQQGFAVFSPIVMCHKIAEDYALGLEAHDWWEFNRPFISSARGVIVLQLDGWDISLGVQAEIELAHSEGKHIEYLDPNTLD